MVTNPATDEPWQHADVRPWTYWFSPSSSPS